MAEFALHLESTANPKAKPVAELLILLDDAGRIIAFSLKAMEGADPAAAAMASYKLGSVFTELK